jgi:hypothetical protein
MQTIRKVLAALILAALAAVPALTAMADGGLD